MSNYLLFGMINVFKNIFANPIGLVLIVIALMPIIIDFITYMRSDYYSVTKNSYFSVRFNTGRLGEYMTYKYIKDLKIENSRFLFNVYVPKENDETSEIDVLMICSKGIFVFESKNYSGWIFGSEYQKNWYQTLPSGKGKSHKEHFYNPVMQNRTHIKHLSAYLGKSTPFYSIIVFSERCTLKSVDIKSEDIKVIKRNNLVGAVSEVYKKINGDILSFAEIEEIYQILYPLSQSSEEVKSRHIQDIKEKHTAEENNVTPVVNESNIIADEQQFVDAPKEEKTIVSEKLEIIETVKEEKFLCPKCGGALILRTANKGENKGKQFLGCENFPKCRYIQKTE